MRLSCRGGLYRDDDILARAESKIFTIGTMAKYRRISRKTALQTLTALLLRGEEDSQTTQEVFEYIKQEFSPELGDQYEFALSLVMGVVQHRLELDDLITERAPEWPLEKLSPVERVILELGSYELLFEKETPLAVIINEWVDLAKEFGDETAGKFTNGVLSAIGNDARPQEKK